MNAMQKQFYDLVISLIVNQKIQDELGIDKIVNEIHMLPMFTTLTNDEISNIKAIITSERSIKLEKGSLIEDHKHEKWFLSKKSELDMRYWNRYKSYLLQDKNFSPDVVNKMDDVLDVLTDLLGNPDTNKNYQRRGLILGDVQSGKTANYTGLICKAADAKYKVIVLLTGTIERLRKQTQQRLDEGFIGLDSSAMIKQLDDVEIGVGKFDPSIHAMVLTSTTDDFKLQTARNLNFNLKTINEPVLFVVKKNVTVLTRLNKWLRTFNQNGENSIDNSLLVIDDEADNASVNTNPEDRNPTAINNQIRDLLKVFARASYVGCTATPYANIFIDPDTSEQMEKEDLFPKDYIYALNAPTNYIGARNVFGDSGSYKSICVEFNDAEETELEEWLPLNHKNGYSISKIPETLKEAICVFFIANAVRDLRLDTKTDRSMLINVSRFNAIQQQIGNYVSSYLKCLQSSARIYSGMPVEEALKDESMEKIHDAYMKHYSDMEFSWDDLQKNLYKSNAPVTSVIVNQNSSKNLNYEDYPDGLRVIAIGGLSLSRGLTLEGLMTSYFYRNSRMYDTLMQMCRWFGYRKNYGDLCTIWMTKTSKSWYKHISDATDELRRDIVRYEDTGLTPLDFGLRVRSDLNTLLVTARNKMRTASSEICTISLSEECIETPDLFIDERKTESNYQAITRLLNNIKLDSLDLKLEGKVKYYKNVNWQRIADLLDEIDIPLSNEAFDPEVLIDFIKQYKGNELKLWDVIFANGSNQELFYIDQENTVNYKGIAFSVVNNDTTARISGSKRRIGTINDGRYGLEQEIYSKVLEKVKNDTNSERQTLRQKDYFTQKYIGVSRNPQLIIYNIILTKPATNVVDEMLNNASQYNGKKVLGFGIGIPKLQDEETKYACYTINKIAKALSAEYDIGEEE